MNYKYNVEVRYANAEVTCKTHDLDVALTFLFEHVDTCDSFDVLDGFTGEVLAHPGYTESDFAFAVLGWLVAKHWG